MDSALCLRHGALHTPPPTTSYAAGLARAYSSFRPSSLSFTPNTSTYRTLSQHTFSSTTPVISCALNNPSPPNLPNSSYKENCRKVVTVVGGASVVLACVLGVINCKCIFNPTAIAGISSRSREQSASTQVLDPTVLTDPKVALDSLLRMNRPLDPPQGYRWFRSPPELDLPARPSPEDRIKLKTGVARLIQSGQLNEAETQLRNLYKKVDAYGSEPRNDVEMELVLVLIFQGNYKEALKCDCLKEYTSVVSDARVQLYKAIIHTMLNQDKDAVECWDKFVSSIPTQKSRLEAKPTEVFTPRQERDFR